MRCHSCQRVEVHLEQLNLNDRLFGSRRKMAMKITMYRKRISRASLALLTASLLSTCNLLTEKPYPISDHSDGKRFYNRDGSDKGLSDISQFLWQSLWNESAWPESLSNPEASTIPDRVNEGIRATYINHATVLIQVDGLNILTDPIWSERASPVTFAGPKRIRPPGIAISDLTEIDLVLISHNHYDHLDTATLRQLRQQQNKEPVIVSGLGNAALLRSLGYNQAIELDWSDSTSVEGTTVHFVECQHRSARGIFDQMRTLWGSFVIETSQGNIYFAGDTGYSPHFKEQGERFGSFALSILPIGTYEPRWFMKDIHLNPEEAVQAYIDLNSEQSLGMHFGVFQLTWEPVDQPVTDLDTALQANQIGTGRFWALEPGQARVITPQQTEF
jgi:L-ascorbate metabolism protein UlaG (beta-lactamase superfamily)